MDNEVETYLLNKSGYPKLILFFRPSLNLSGKMAEYLGFYEIFHENTRDLDAGNLKYPAIA